MTILSIPFYEPQGHQIYRKNLFRKPDLLLVPLPLISDPSITMEDHPDARYSRALSNQSPIPNQRQGQFHDRLVCPDLHPLLQQNR
jgi:hypothetical protein